MERGDREEAASKAREEIYAIKSSIRPLIPLYRRTLQIGGNAGDEALRDSLHDVLVEKYRKILHILEGSERSERVEEEKRDVMEQLRFMEGFIAGRVATS